MGLSGGGLICGGAYLSTSLSVSAHMGLSAGELICGGAYLRNFYGILHDSAIKKRGHVVDSSSKRVAW